MRREQWLGLGFGALCCLACTGGLEPATEPTPAKEDCADGVDNDGNKLADCEDPACADLCAQPEDKKKDTKTKTKTKGKTKRRDRGENGFGFEGFVGEGLPSFVAQRRVEVPRYDRWKRGTEVGRCVLTKGERLNVKQSVSLTYEGIDVAFPRTGRVHGINYGDVRFLTKKQYLDQQKEVAIRLADVESVVLLQARAEGSCFFRVDGEVMLTGCDAFHINNSMPPVVWWIEVDCDGKGWVRVDDLGDRVKEERAF